MKALMEFRDDYSDMDRDRRGRHSHRNPRTDRPRNRTGRHYRNSPDGYSSDLESSSNSDSDVVHRPPGRGLRPWKPTDHRFHDACDYKTYRLQQVRGRMGARASRSTRKKGMDVEVTMTGHMFDGKDPIKVIGFLRRLKRDIDRSDMTEASLYLVLPNMLR